MTSHLSNFCDRTWHCWKNTASNIVYYEYFRITKKKSKVRQVAKSYWRKLPLKIYFNPKNVRVRQTAIEKHNFPWIKLLNIKRDALSLLSIYLMKNRDVQTYYNVIQMWSSKCPDIPSTLKIWAWLLAYKGTWQYSNVRTFCPSNFV